MVPIKREFFGHQCAGNFFANSAVFVNYTRSKLLPVSWLSLQEPWHSSIWNSLKNYPWIVMTESRNFGYESDRTRNVLICKFCIYCLRKSFVLNYLSISGTRIQHKWIIHAATPCSHGQQGTKWIGQKRQKVTSNVNPCECMFHWLWQWYWLFIDSDNVVLALLVFWN